MNEKKVKELVIISGKGGTGKTSLTASFAVLAGKPVIADCDVDAADLHLVLSPQLQESHEFISGHEAIIDHAKCNSCGLCKDFCQFSAIKVLPKYAEDDLYQIDPLLCEGCGVCVWICPKGAIDFKERNCGKWMVSHTRCGTMVHAKLGVAAENSGKLVSLVRQKARQIAAEEHSSLILSDGPPGIGCPVIASITGASQVLVVTEPSVSGLHDLKRVITLINHFYIPTNVCVNKWDINGDLTEQIEKNALELGARVLGRIRYDTSFTKAQLQELSVVETNSPSANDIKKIWEIIIH